MRYTRRPATVDAWPVWEVLYDAINDWESVPDEVKAGYGEGELATLSPEVLLVRTLEGDIRATRNDMLVKGADGEWYPYCRKKFVQHYDVQEKQR